MSDIENEKDLTPDQDATDAELSANASAKTSSERSPERLSDTPSSKKRTAKKSRRAQDDELVEEAMPSGPMSVKDLVASAGAAFGLLDDEPTSSEPATSNDEPAHTEGHIEEPTATTQKKGGKKGGGKKNKKAEADIVADVEWNDSTKNLDFAADSADASESATQSTSESAPESVHEADGLSAFEELARRVAATVAKNKGTDEEQLIEREAHETADAIILSEANEIAREMAAAHHDPSAEAEPEPESETDEALLEASGEAHVITDTEPGTQQASFFEEPTEAPEPEAEAEPMEETNVGALEEKLDAAENDAAAEPENFVDSDQLQSIVESLLFSTDKPVSVSTIKQMFKNTNVRTKDISRALDMLASEYASPTRGISLEEINGGYQLRTKPDNSDFMKRLAKVRPFRLSGPALEVMAIVAYKQPVTKGEIDEIRGVESGHLLRALMERGLVAFGEKSDLPGKPMNYNSTRKFLEIFGLRNIRELPTLSEIDELLPEGIGEVEEKETLSDITDSMSTQVSDGTSFSEGEDELAEINEQLQHVDTTSAFFEEEKVRERERRDRDRAQDIRERMVVGEAVEEKDRRWLDRYDAKLAQPAVAATAAPLDETAGVGDALETLTEETQLESTVASDGDESDETTSSETDWSGAELDPEDLSANPDYAGDDDDHGSDSEKA